MTQSFFKAIEKRGVSNPFNIYMIEQGQYLCDKCGGISLNIVKTGIGSFNNARKEIEELGFELEDEVITDARKISESARQGMLWGEMTILRYVRENTKLSLSSYTTTIEEFNKCFRYWWNRKESDNTPCEVLKVDLKRENFILTFFFETSSYMRSRIRCILDFFYKLKGDWIDNVNPKVESILLETEKKKRLKELNKVAVTSGINNIADELSFPTLISKSPVPNKIASLKVKLSDYIYLDLTFGNDMSLDDLNGIEDKIKEIAEVVSKFKGVDINLKQFKNAPAFDKQMIVKTKKSDDKE